LLDARYWINQKTNPGGRPPPFFYPAQENPPVELSAHMLPIPDPMKLAQLINFWVF